MKIDIKNTYTKNPKKDELKNIYKGSSLNGKYHGKGQCTYPDGTIYEGDFQNGEREGKGKCTYPNGDKYEGEWKSDKREGKGTMTIRRDGYEGSSKLFLGKYTKICYATFIKDKMAEEEVFYMVYGDNCTYYGEMKNGKMDGKGILKDKNGDIYKGQFKEDQREGKGETMYRLGKSNYTPFLPNQWSQDKMQGEAKYTDNNGTTYELKERTTYELKEMMEEDKETVKDSGGKSEPQPQRVSRVKITYSNDLPGHEFSVQDWGIKGARIIFESKKSQKDNDTPTLVIYSEKMKKEDRKLNYETHKFTDGGKKIETAVCGDGKPEEAIGALAKFITNNPGEKKCRIVFDQHGYNDGSNDMQIREDTAEKMLQHLLEAGLKSIIISDLACHGSTAQNVLLALQQLGFEEALIDSEKAQQGSVDESKVIVKVRSGPTDKETTDGYKKNGNSTYYSLVVVDEKSVFFNRQERKMIVERPHYNKLAEEKSVSAPEPRKPARVFVKNLATQQLASAGKEQTKQSSLAN